MTCVAPQLWYTACMNKTLDAKTIAELSRYTAEELDPALANDEKAVDEFIKRNREALNKALEAGYISLKSGGGVMIHSLDELLAALENERNQAKH